jgi:hypothetical protein
MRRQFREGIVDPRSTRHLQRGPPEQVRRKFQAVNDDAARRIRNQQQKMQTQRQILAQLRTEMENVGVPVVARRSTVRRTLADDVLEHTKKLRARLHTSQDFMDTVDLSPREVLIREIAKREGIALNDAEDISREFKRFDEDGSGAIEYGEFSKLVLGLAGGTVSAQELRALWLLVPKSDASEDSVDLKSFLPWFYRSFGAPADFRS